MVKHIYAQGNPSNGVTKYGQWLDRLIDYHDLTLPDFYHFELGYTDFKSLWRADKIRKQGLPYILTLHDPPIVTGKPFDRFLPGRSVLTRMLRKLLDRTLGLIVVRRVVWSAKAIIILNPCARSSIIKTFKLPSDRIWSVPHPLYFPALPRADKFNTTFDITFFGNLSPHKGIDVLISAFELAFFEVPIMATLTIIGSGDDKSYIGQINHKISSSSLKSHIIMAGFLEDEALARQLSKSDVVVLPYKNTGIIHASGPLIASMSTGTGVIATDLPIFRGEITHGKTGWLFPEGDIHALSQQLWSLSGQPDYVRKVGQAGRAYIMKTHDSEQIKAELMKIYRSL